MTFAELQDEVYVLVRDASPEIVSRIPNALNEALFTLAAMERIPELMSIGSFTTVEAASVAQLPSNFSGRLLKVGTSSQGIVIHPGGLEGLLSDVDNFGTEAGEVEIVAQEGTNIWYSKMPAVATNYLILYQMLPTELVADEDTLPRWLPSYFGRGILAHGAAEILYNIIEDGMEQEKTETLVQRGLAQGFVGKFQVFLSQSRKGYNTSIWSV